MRKDQTYKAVAAVGFGILSFALLSAMAPEQALSQIAAKTAEAPADQQPAPQVQPTAAGQMADNAIDPDDVSDLDDPAEVDSAPEEGVPGEAMVNDSPPQLGDSRKSVETVPGEPLNPGDDTTDSDEALQRNAA